MIQFDPVSGLIPVVIQHYQTKEVLMVAYMNEEAFGKTLETGLATFWSRSRNKLWVKGKEQSGNFLYVKEIRVDCDDDTLLLLVDPKGPACHTGEKSCFYDTLREKLIKKLYFCYQYLKDADVEKVSFTSKMLKTKESDFFKVRMEEEFKELEDVILGKHSHSDSKEQDIILEATQVWYWIVLWHIFQNHDFNTLQNSPKLERLKVIIEQNNCSIDRILWEDMRQMRGKEYMRDFFKN